MFLSLKKKIHFHFMNQQLGYSRQKTILSIKTILLERLKCMQPLRPLKK